jgi:hypothetical protein
VPPDLVWFVTSNITIIPVQEAFLVDASPSLTPADRWIKAEPQEAGHYTLMLADVPVDAFWSITVYNRDGYLEPNPYGSYSLNSVTTQADGSTYVLNLAPEPAGLANHLYVMDGWNCGLRLYRPRAAVLEKSWIPPTPQPAD